MSENEWILNYIEKNGPVDMLNENFVKSFIKEFEPKYHMTLYGAYKCKRLSELLRELYRVNLLERATIGIGGGEGLPNWIYSYDLK